MNRGRKMQGQLVGGNLSIINNLIGTANGYKYTRENPFFRRFG